MTFKQFIPPAVWKHIHPAADRIVRYLEDSPRPAGLTALPSGLDPRLHDDIVRLLKKAAWFRGDQPNFAAFITAVHLTQASPHICHLLVTLAARESSKFPNVTAWLVYWAAIEAQHRFSSIFCGLASHEERLTGHLISEFFAAKDRLVNEIDAQLEAGKAGSDLPRIFSDLQEGLGGDFAYADLSTQRQEQHTGADWGLIVKREFSRAPPAYIPLRFQAKKSGSNGRANIKAGSRRPPDHQLVRLTRSGIGYYIYYHVEKDDVGSIPPMVQSADYITKTRQPIGAVNTYQDSLDLASFILQLLLAEPDEFVTDSTLEDAVERIVAADEKPPGLIMAVSTGEAGIQPLQAVLQAACESYRIPTPDPEPPSFED